MKPGHNSGDNRLKSLADRIERLMDERDGIQSDIRDIYAEAKSAGYVPKVLRKAITRKRMDPSKRDEEDTILDLYEGALTPTMRKAVAMAAKGASAREIETETGIDQATVARSVSLNKKSETDTPAPQGLSLPTAPETTGAATLVVAPASQNGGVEAGTSFETDDEVAAATSVGAVASESERVATPFLGDDPGPPPAFLRRSA